MNNYGFIYITTNMINGKRYIGQKKFIDGWEKYIGSGSVLKKAINKYGREKFKRVIIEICDSKKELDNAEINYISFFNAQKSNDWYNITSGGEGASYKKTKITRKKISNTLLGHEVSKETREKLRQAHKGKKLSEEHKKKVGRSGADNGFSKYIAQYDLNNNFIATYGSAREATRITGVNFCGISMACNKKRNTAGGYIWKFVALEDCEVA